MSNVSIYKCPHCGREYSSRACKPNIPQHADPFCRVLHQGVFTPVNCPGSGQVPRNAASDHRPLWKDLAKATPQDTEANGGGR